MAKILIADDEAIERAALTFILRNSNLDIELIGEAASGRQAVAKALKYSADIIIMDIKMPGLDGLEAARQIKRVNPGCKIIMLTAYGYFDYAQTAIKIGVEDYVVKPVNNQALIEVIQKVLLKLEEEQSQKRKYAETEMKLRQVTQYFANEILSSMAAGDIEEERIEEYFNNLGIVFNLGVAAILALKNEEPSIPESIEKRWYEQVRDLIFNYQIEYLLSQQRNRLNLLLILKDMDEYNRVVPMLFNELENLINEQGYRLSIGVSKPFTQVSWVSKAFFQARVESNKLDEQERVIFYNQSRENGEGDLKYPLDKERILYEKLIKGEKEGVLTAFSEIWAWMVRTSETQEELKEKAHQLIVIIHRLIIEEFNISERLEHYRNEVQPLKEIKELEACCQTILLRFMGKIREVMKEPSTVIIEEVCQYIGENYMNEITLDSIASRVGFSRFYFCKLFKQCKGMNFIDFLTLVRIGKSKELLKNTKLSVKDIGYSVGYCDPNYYTSVFKKTEGISPTEYRNRCL